MEDVSGGPGPGGRDVAAEGRAFRAFCAAGLWPGLGTTVAGRLTGAGITSTADVSATRLATIEGLGPARADRLVRGLAAAAPVLAVVELLDAAGLPVAPAARVVEELGDTAAAALRQDPWRLLRCPGVPVHQADRLARSLLAGTSPADARRGPAIAEHALAEVAREGSTGAEPAAVHLALREAAVPDPTAAVTAALTAGRLVTVSEIEPSLLALPRYADAEQQVGDGIARLLATAQPLRPPGQRTLRGLDETQAAAVRAGAAHGFSLLVGGPGTGKSRTVAALVSLARARRRRIALAAPTGRAAKRLEELTGEPATTVHRLLGAQGQDRAFARDADWPLDADLVVVDETSMLDVELAAALLDACPDGAHLLLVGDPAQLPSIGPGRVLGDLVDCGLLPTTQLTTLYRQDEGGAIARLAMAVRDGELPAVDSADRQVVLVPATGAVEAAHRTLQLVTDSIPRAIGIAAEDIQVVTPVHRGPAGTVALNAALKARLNPGTGTIGGFDVGDRVVATANHLDAGFANGEVGTVSATGNGVLTVTFASGPVTVPGRAVRDLRHGWAVTVHRAQGSEWPAVVAVLPPEAGGLLSRPLFYTAITRASRHLSVVHAAGPALARAVHDRGNRPRTTALAARLAAALR
ncbi:MAG: AAA family ATPase [Actinomycetota bacterium]|nr:AAA family ATPase [Actinomycetota bacterium]